MALTFADTHNMIAYLTKSNASEGFNQIIYFLNASSIKYALTVNPNIYVSCIKQFWISILVKTVNDVPRLQALVDKKKVIITKATIRDALCLNDAEGIDCLPNEEIYTELERMGYEKPSTKLTFYKAFFSSQWKFLIHTILQCMSAKSTSWNEFSLFMASAVICFSTGAAEVNVEDISAVGVADEGAASVNVDDVPAVIDEPSIPSPTSPTQLPPPSQDIPSTSQDKITQALEITKLKQRVKKLERMNKLKASKLRRLKKDVAAVAKDVKDAEIEESADVQGRQAESQAQIYQIDLEHADKVLSMQEDDIEPTELQEVVEVVTTAKLIIEVVTAASTTITVADTPIPAATITVVAPTLTTAPSAARRRKGVVIRDPEETATPSTIIHTEPKSKDKEKGIMVHEPKPLMKKT
uniref:Ribonuclease H-like domain, reverse transcriptase, RNA-dependent DNA polymerase n=1 Tax=Tanacetum cinerariifolium TaxID=118510 RepID=A0A699H437_TANCI|nr:ribonuclease H-like domain, reverse transcriptase, RNA-dependent DNA polymerase [Tanacetum cinerariifolium]